MKSLRTLVPALFLLALLLSCQQGNSPNSQEESFVVNPEVPKLLDRNESLHSGKEWEEVQNYYGSNVQQLRQNPEAPSPKLNLAILFTNEARITGEHPYYYPAALQLLDEILAKDIEDKDLKFRTLSTKAGVLLSLHQFEEALQTGKEAVKLNEFNAQIYGVLVDANVELGNYEEAVKMADKMVTIRPDLRSYARISYLREIHGNVEGAIEAMEMAAMSGAPGFEETAWTRLTLGQLYQQYGELEKARQQYQRILQERPGYPFATAALAEIAMQEEDFAKAEKLLQEALDVIPEVGFTIQLAELYQRTGRAEEAKEIANSVIPMLKEDEEAGHNMNLEYANVYANLLNDTDQAITYAMKEYQKRPANIDVNMVLADLYVQQKDYESARKHLELAKTTNSKDPMLTAVSNELEVKTDI